MTRVSSASAGALRLRLFLALLFTLAVGYGAALLHARARMEERASAAPAHRAVALATGLPDLCLSTSSRWLRHPSQAEPGAAFADGPASLDVDPSGMAIAPPIPLLLEVERGAEGARGEGR